MDRPTGVFINYLTVCCQSLSIKKMIELTQEELKQYFSEPIFGHIAETADALGLECYVVGGYVRDIFLQRPSKDIDVVVVGSGIAMAEALGKRLGRGAHVSVFKNFGTAQVKYKGTEVEFVGARKESYQRDSRKPIVEDGTLEDDQNRRDFTINAMAVCLNKARFGELVDPFGGMADMKEKTIRIYDINRDLYSYIYNIDSSLLENNQKTTLCIYISAEKHCDACIEFELKYIRKNALENNIIILYHASHKSSFNSFKEFNKDFHSIYFCPENTKFNDFPTYIIINEGIIKHIYKSNTNRNGGALNYFLNTLKNFLK